MDSKSYLRKYGWKPGSGLHGEKGIQKPILVAHKSDVLGLGNKKHNHADHWWERAFDSSLKTLSVDTTSGAGDVRVKQTDHSGALTLLVTKGVAKDLSWEGTQSPLYRHFVKGALLEGTFKPEETRSNDTTDSEQSVDIPVEYKSKKRKREDDETKDRKKKSKLKSTKSKSKDKSEKKRKEKKSSRVEELAINEALKEKAPSDSGIEITSEPEEQEEVKAKKNKDERKERKEKSKEKKEKKDKDKSKKDKEKPKKDKVKSKEKEKSKDKSRREKKKQK